MKRTFIAALVLSAATATGAIAQGSTKQDNTSPGASQYAPGQIQRDRDIPAKEKAPGQRARDTDRPAKEFAPGQRMNEEKKTQWTSEDNSSTAYLAPASAGALLDGTAGALSP